MELSDRFIVETAEHEMTVLHEENPYLHLRFGNSDSSGYWFELITTPSAIVFRGEGESFVFGGMRDIQALYRHGRWSDGSLHFDPTYWASKLTSLQAAAREYSQARFDAHATELIRAAQERFPGIETAWLEFAYGEGSEYNLEYEDGAREALAAFYYGELKRSVCTTCNSEIEYDSTQRPPAVWREAHEGLLHIRYTNTLVGFRFRDPEPAAFDDFGWWFLFACSAVMWGMNHYDRHRAAREAQNIAADALVTTAVA